MIKITIAELKDIVEKALCESSFDKMKQTFSQSDEPVPHTFVAYHWTETPEEANRVISLWEKKKLDKKGLFVTDDIDTWNVNVSSVIRMKVTVNNPMVIDDDDNLESWLGSSKSQNKITLLKRNRFDSIVSVPTDEIMGTRQMLLFYPNTQITSMKVDHNSDRRIMSKTSLG